MLHPSWRPCGVVVAYCLFATVAHADIYAPGQSVPYTSSDPFTWNLDDANSSYSHWDFFEAVPTNTAGAPLSDSTPDVASFGNSHTINIGAGSLPVGSGNAYSPFLPLEFDAIVNPVTGAGLDNTRVVMQLSTSGSELDRGSIFMNVNSIAGVGTLEPSLHIETLRSPFAGPFGSGVDVDHFLIWDVPTNTDYRIDFDAAASSLSLSEFRIDTFSQTDPFISITAVPEPSSVFAAATFCLFGCICVRRRKRKQSDQKSLSAAN